MSYIFLSGWLLWPKRRSTPTAEIEGREPEVRYDHELMLVIDEGGEDSIYLHHKLWEEEAADLRQGRFWSWAKQAHARYWPRLRGFSPIELAKE